MELNLKESISEHLFGMESATRSFYRRSISTIKKTIHISPPRKMLDKWEESIEKFYLNLQRGNDFLHELNENLILKSSPEKFERVLDLLHWRLNWDKRDIDYKDNSLVEFRSLSAREVAQSISNNSTVFTSGFGSNGRCALFFWAIREEFEKNSHPQNLTWISVSAQGGRGKVPGTIEELGVPGLLQTYISGHLETAKSLLKLAEEGQLELHTLPQGELSFLLEEQAKGNSSILSKTGLGTFLDPTIGRGSAVMYGDSKYIQTAQTEDGERCLQYSIPLIDVALISAPYCDKQGNIYFDKASAITECREAALAAKANGGKVFVATSKIIDAMPDKVGIDAECIDGIVVYPENEQMGGIQQKKYWNMFTENAREDVDEALSSINLINSFMGITPFRRKLDSILSRMAMHVFMDGVKQGSVINLGVGMPEEVGKILYKTGVYKNLNFTTESGVFGGVPTPGIFFGAAINPVRIGSSSEMFHLYEEKLDICVLGFLQVDSQGNVNVSRRGNTVRDFIGPGGFCNISQSAKVIVFIGSWMTGGKSEWDDQQVKCIRRGEPKFLAQVDEITFNGQQALQDGKQVFYISDVGLFRLTPEGLKLVYVFPGVDVKRDVLGFAKAKILVDAAKPAPRYLFSEQEFNGRMQEKL
ncbi:MAG: CoA-transferase [Spirochaetota bacterium]